MARVRQIPQFRTEAEEARWWDKQGSRIARDVEAAVASREDLTVVPAPLARAIAAKNITIRLSLADLERARLQAQRRGLRYQTYVKMLLHQALEADARRLA
jgi:predicted DNA binding CopG/RHH family protein